jgi:hypothetical protein
MSCGDAAGFRGETITQPDGNPNRRERRRGGEPQGGHADLERDGCALDGTTLGHRRRGQRATEPRKCERGEGVAKAARYRRGQETPEGTSPRRHRHGNLAKPQTRGPGSARRANPAGGVRSDDRKNLRRGAAPERVYGGGRGTRPRRVNPKGGTGMEQAQQAARGARRREGEKPWGRNVTGGNGKPPG